MARSSIFAAALGATALLVMGSSAAFANAPAPLPITGVGEAPASAGGTGTDTTTPATPPAEVPSAGTVVEPAPAPPVVAPVAPPTTTDSTSTSTATTTSSGGEGTTLTDPKPATPAAESPLEVGEGIRTDVIQADAPADGRGAASVASEAGAAAGAPSGNSHPAATGGGVILERLLPGVERRLRGVQTQMDDLNRRLAAGGTPTSNTLVRLRRSLELIAPALAALGARVDAGGPLSPDLRQLLHRVNSRLDGAHVSAGALAAALRRSGVRGPELAALLRELDGFGTSAPMFSAVTSLAPSHPLYATGGAYTQAPPTTVAPTEPVHRAAAPQREMAVHEAAASTQSPASDEVVRQVAASGSASAGPGGAFSAAGIAGLAALLALTLPRLLTRVQLMTARSYKAAFLVPLQRPG